MGSTHKQTGYRYAEYGIPDPDFDKYEDLESPFAEVEDLSVPAMREIAAQMPVTFPYGEDEVASVSISHERIKARDGAELELRIYKDKSLDRKGILFFVTHGGGWVFGDHSTEEAMNRLVAKRTSSVVVSVNYRLQCRENAESLEIDANRVIVGGSSSGGIIAAALALKDGDEGIGAIFGQVLNIPDTWHPTHFPKDRFEYYSPEQNKDAPILTTEAAHWFWDLYCATDDADCYASPLLASYHEGYHQHQDVIPSATTGWLTAKHSKPVPVKTKIYPRLPHAFCLFPDLKETRTYFSSIVDWINFLDKDLAKIL
ncbi:Alpha/Beta hydrolase protein [Aspergillus lucknowensis]|uniref:Alpha/Beta hydrolase protein n=1 Tax=Aspergillus lucknowensis TaxID=176173 RepID=A0ABR4LNG1_9EURO